MQEYFIFGLLGLISGVVFYFLAIQHVKVRVGYDSDGKLKMLKNIKCIWIWIIAAEVMFLGVAWMRPNARWLELNDWQTVRLLVFALLAFNVSVIDILLRRIPNEILLGMLVLQIVNMVLEIISIQDVDRAFGVVMKAFVGMLLAYIFFAIPAMFGLSIGAGDVKYSTVIGFMLGFFGFVEAMAVMCVSIILFYIYLKATKKGNLKTAAPMAPFLSIGVLMALLLPIF